MPVDDAQGQYTQPLSGIRVLELAHLIAGPQCCMILADMGADVIKIEPPGKGDGLRSIGSIKAGGEGAMFFSYNRNKKSVAVDVDVPDGLNVVLELARRSDVLVENFRPGVAARLGVGCDALRELNPRLIYCSISSFGQSGPYRDRAAIDSIIQGYSGIMSITGEADRGPARVGSPIADNLGAQLAVQGIMFALFHRERTGLAQRVEISLLDGLIAMQAPREQTYFIGGEMPQRWGSAIRELVPHQAFVTQDIYINVDVISEEAWRRFCRALEIEPLMSDPRFASNDLRVEHRDELVPLLEDVFRRRPGEEWMRILAEHNIPAGPINTLDRVFHDPQVLHNQMVRVVQHPTIGPLRVLGIPVRLSSTPGVIRRAPPILGAHTDEVLDSLGYDAPTIRDLRARGVVG